jgi:hypothetical protein
MGLQLRSNWIVIEPQLSRNSYSIAVQWLPNYTLKVLSIENNGEREEEKNGKLRIVYLAN